MIADVDSAGGKADLSVGADERISQDSVLDAGVGKHDAVAHDGTGYFGSFPNRDVQPNEGVDNPGAAPLTYRPVFT